MIQGLVFGPLASCCISLDIKKRNQNSFLSSLVLHLFLLIDIADLFKYVDNFQINSLK